MMAIQEAVLGEIYTDVDQGGTSWGETIDDSEMTVECPVCNKWTHAGWGTAGDIGEFFCEHCKTCFRIITDGIELHLKVISGD